MFYNYFVWFYYVEIGEGDPPRGLFGLSVIRETLIIILLVALQPLWKIALKRNMKKWKREGSYDTLFRALDSFPQNETTKIAVRLFGSLGAESYFREQQVKEEQAR